MRRPLGSMMSMLGHIDAVHGAYYLLIHVLAKLGTSEAVLRMPSVVAMAAAAWFTAALGRDLAGARTGLACGLLFAVSPVTTEYAHDARPFALVTCLAALASYRFVSFVRTGTRRDAAWYGAVLAACGLMNVFGMLLVVSHAVTLAASPVRADRVRRFGFAAGAATLVVSPVAWLAATEISQVGWERKPSAYIVFGLLTSLVVAGIAARVAVRGARSSSVQSSATLGTAPLIRLSAAWLLLPLAILLIASQIPIPAAPGASISASAGAGIWEPRYLLFCIPGLVLFVVGLISRLNVKISIIVTSAVMAGAVAAQPLARPATSSDDIRAVATLLQARSRDGDAVVFPDIAKRLIKDAYPAGFTHVTDVGLDRSPAARNSLYGLNASPRILWQRLAGTKRVWLVTFPVPRPGRYYGHATRPRAFCLERTWRFPLNMVRLYHRCRQ
ncbi:MAG TPA: glycosyltransferase family 39 protein [Streptosporangiaceae bacterium]|nr:glycosyltransferase family 39 protein [Streptosporangiaceae bacterium]